MGILFQDRVLQSAIFLRYSTRNLAQNLGNLLRPVFFHPTLSHYHNAKKPYLGWFGMGLAYFYLLLSKLHQKWRQAQLISLPQDCPPIISIGNLTTGGTGKTPVVIALAQYYESLGMRCLILSRGYGGHPNKDGTVISAQQGDEAFLIQSQLQQSQVLTGKNRVQLLKNYLRHYKTGFKADVIILDDGYQYTALPRHLNILLIDGTLGFGNGHLLPAGPLREPMSALKRADVILLTKKICPDLKRAIETQLHQLQHYIPVLECPFESSQKLSLLGSGESIPCETLLNNNNYHIGIVTAIAHPHSFIENLRETGILIHQTFIFSDHHMYTDANLQQLQTWLNTASQNILIATSKDAVKLHQFPELIASNKVWVQNIHPLFNWQTIVENKSLMLYQKSHYYANPAII